MDDFKYQMVKVCTRMGREYYHIYPIHPLDRLPNKLQGIHIKVKNSNYLVVELKDCTVVIFPSGRMLIEDLPEENDERAHKIVREILSRWL